VASQECENTSAEDNGALKENMPEISDDQLKKLDQTLRDSKFHGKVTLSYQHGRLRVAKTERTLTGKDIDGESN